LYIHFQFDGLKHFQTNEHPSVKVFEKSESEFYCNFVLYRKLLVIQTR